MSKYLIKKSTIVEICDAIRAKNNTTTQYTINDIADAILDLKGIKEKYKVLIDYAQPISFGDFTINTNEYTESLNILPIKPLSVFCQDLWLWEVLPWRLPVRPDQAAEASTCSVMP